MAKDEEEISEKAEKIEKPAADEQEIEDSEGYKKLQEMEKEIPEEVKKEIEKLRD